MKFFRRSRSSKSTSKLIGYLGLFFLGIVFIKLLLPLIILAGIVWGAYKLWKIWSDRQKANQLQAQQQQSALNQAFYSLVQKYNGRVSLLDLSMTANIDPQEAKQFLDTKAKEFMAEFEPTDNGQILYIFNSLSNQPFPIVDQTPSELTSNSLD